MHSVAQSDVSSPTSPTSPLEAQALWRSILITTASQAYANLPDNASRIDAALQLVVAGQVSLHDNGTATIQSRTTASSYTVSGSTCTCPDFLSQRAPLRYCKHRLAHALLVRTQEAVAAYTPPARPAAATADVGGIPAAFLVMRHGTTWIRYAGLRWLAQRRGVVLQVKVVSVSEALAVCEATARMADGQMWVDIGDAAPTNVDKQQAPHFIRMAATRAKARVLREALGVPYPLLEDGGADEADEAVCGDLSAPEGEKP